MRVLPPTNSHSILQRSRLKKCGKKCSGNDCSQQPDTSWSAPGSLPVAFALVHHLYLEKSLCAGRSQTVKAPTGGSVSYLPETWRILSVLTYLPRAWIHQW